MFRIATIAIISLVFINNNLFAQKEKDIVAGAELTSDKNLAGLAKRISRYNDLIAGRTKKILDDFQQKERSLKDKISGRDSALAQNTFVASEAQYTKLRLENKNGNHMELKNYMPGLDSMQTALGFLQQENVNLPASSLKQVQALSNLLQQLKGNLANAENAQEFIIKREQQLRAQLSAYSAGKDLAGMNQKVYYYQQQMAQYKATINDPEKLKATFLNTVRELPAFKSFWQKNSWLARLFPLPAGYGTNAALTGLQTNAQVQAQAMQQLGASPGGNASQYLQQQADQAENALTSLKTKVQGLGGTKGSGDMEMPDFKPNSQKTKSILERLEYSFNIQNEANTALLPSMSDLGLMLGYRLNDNLTAGTGISYKLGMGNGWNHIHFSSQGVGLRSYVDAKLKGSIWITGGWEYNYFHDFEKLNSLKNIEAWQKSALLGFTKKYKVGKKNGNIQLLYDLLASHQLPARQSIKFRVGLGF